MTTRNMLDGGQVIVDYLIREKVPYAFGLCGHGNIRFIDALYERSSEIKTISVHHETRRRLHGRRLLPRLGPADRDLHLVRPGSANLPIALANAYLDSVPFLAVTGNVPDQPVQPRRVSGNVSPLSGRFSVDGARLLQARVPADARPRSGAAAIAPGMEDHGDRPARAGGARRAVRHFHGRRSRKRRRARRSGMPISRAAAAPIPRAWRRRWTCCSAPSGR